MLDTNVGRDALDSQSSLEVEVGSHGSRTSGETISPEVDASSRCMSEVPSDEVVPATLSPTSSSPSSNSQPRVLTSGLTEGQQPARPDVEETTSSGLTEALATEGPASLDPTGT